MTIADKASKSKKLVLMLIFTSALFACNSRPIQNLTSSLTQTRYESPNLTESQQLILDTVWNDVNDNYLREDFGGTDWGAVQEQYTSKLSADLTQDDFNVLLEEMVGEIPNSGIKIITRAERIEQSISQANGNSGIGPFVAVRDGATEEPRLIVLHVIPGSAAVSAGIRSHDAILSINGEPISIGEGEAALRKLRGEPGSELQLVVRSPQQEPRIVTIIRRGVRSEPAPLRSAVLPQTNILYVAFPAHEDRSILNEFSAVLDRLQAQDDLNKGLIIDMRLMTGIQRTAIFQLLPLFVNGDIASRNNQGEVNPITINGILSPLQEASRVAMAIIVGPETAGPAELFAAALQDQGRAVIVGQTTAGSLEEIEAQFLQNGSQLVMPTSTLIMTNSQRDIGQLGVEPDVQVNANWDEVTADFDPVLDQAIASIFTTLGIDQ
ncbi:MAG: S41 family peptidase [Anaerolineae bacterium]